LALFNTPSSGNFFRPAAGQYIGRFVGHSVGPMGKDFGDGKPPQEQVRWTWELFNLDRTPVLHEGQPAKVDALSSKSTGPRSKGGSWFAAHLKRPLKEGEDMELASQECIGKEVMLIYTDPDGNGVRLQAVLTFS